MILVVWDDDVISVVKFHHNIQCIAASPITNVC